MKNLLGLNILIATFVLSAFGVMHSGYHIGDTAEDFKLKNVDGEMISFSNFHNVNGYIVTFTCNHCPYAVMYEDRLIEIHKKYSALGYPVIAINPNDPYLFDEGQKVYPKFGATKTPHIFLLDAEKTVRYIGAIDDSPRDASAVEEKYLENAIDALIAGKSPNPETTKALGCSIKSVK